MVEFIVYARLESIFGRIDKDIEYNCKNNCDFCGAEKISLFSNVEKEIVDYFILYKLEFSSFSSFSKVNSKVYDNCIAVWFPIVQFLSASKVIPNPFYKKMLFF